MEYFPENDILPYDHFSIPENILKERFRILNSINLNKKIVISTIKNLFEVYPTLDFFKSANNFNIRDKLSIGSLEEILLSLNYIKANRIDSINQYAFRGGIVDVYTHIYKNPLRIEIFDDTIESIRFFDVDNQLSVDKTDSFSLSKGTLLSLDEFNLKIFKNKL